MKMTTWAMACLSQQATYPDGQTRVVILIYRMIGLSPPISRIIYSSLATFHTYAIIVPNHDTPTTITS